MLSELRQQKFTHLFQILDFNHDGLLEKTDFQSLGENIAIFRCLRSPSEIEDLINRRGREIWDAIRLFLDDQQSVTQCNLENWLQFLENITDSKNDRRFNVLSQKSVRDIFYIYDKNLDNYLSKQEYLCFFVSLRVGIKQADECFRAMDLNDDMLISKKELHIAITEFFKSDDEGSPGNLLFGDPKEFGFKTRSSFY